MREKPRCNFNNCCPLTNDSNDDSPIRGRSLNRQTALKCVGHEDQSRENKARVRAFMPFHSCCARFRVCALSCCQHPSELGFILPIAAVPSSSMNVVRLEMSGSVSLAVRRPLTARSWQVRFISCGSYTLYVSSVPFLSEKCSHARNC